MFSIVKARFDCILVRIVAAAGSIRNSGDSDHHARIVFHRAGECSRSVRDGAFKRQTAVRLLAEMAGIRTHIDGISIHGREDHQIAGIRLADSASRLRLGKGVVGGESKSTVFLDFQIHGHAHARLRQVNRIDTRHIDGVSVRTFAGSAGSQTDRQRRCQHERKQDRKEFFHFSVS